MSSSEATNETMTNSSNVSATPGKRLAAYIINNLIIFPLAVLFYILYTPGNQSLQLFAIFFLPLGYLAIVISLWKKGTTPGHKALKLYVVDSKTGETLTLGRMALRELVMKGIVGGFLSVITFGIYWIVDSLFVIREDKRTIHDLMSSTSVVQR